MTSWRDLRGRLRTRWLKFERAIGDVRRHERRPALTVLHNWNVPLHSILPHEPPERQLVAHALLEETRRIYRHGVRFGFSDQALEEDIGELPERISHILEKPVPFPRRSDGARQHLGEKATNIGLEIEVNSIYVQARVGTRGPVVSAANGGFLAKCMFDESPKGYTGFSVQSDGGHVELVSDPPTRGLSPAATAAGMARYVESVQKELLSRKGQAGPWRAARRAIPDANDVHQALEHRGKTLQIRLEASRRALDGTFHVTVGVHLSAIPWLFASGASDGKDIEKVDAMVAGDPPGFPFPGYVIRDAEKNRKDVLKQMQGLRNSEAGLTLSPEFEGLAFLIYTYLAVARSKDRGETLSPKQHFLVLARTDFASMLKLTSEWKQNRAAEQWADKGQKLKNALLKQVKNKNGRIFNDRFGDRALPLGDVMDAALGIGDDLPRRINDRANDNTVYTRITTTPKQWLDKLFAAQPSDMLTPDYQKLNNTPYDPALFRGMGELGDKTDDISVGALRPFKVPLLELRQVTPTSNLPSVGKWGPFTERVVDMITALNAPASREDVRLGVEELEWIRAVSDGPRFPRPDLAAADREAETDRICAEIRHLLNSVYMRAELWTLLDRARNLTRPGTTVRGALDRL